jgi:nitrogen fixation/metabolism regulation signal transduction histidine kinase
MASTAAPLPKDPKQAALDLSALQEKEALALANSKRNEIKEIRNHKQLEKVDLDFDSPRLKQALYNLGVSKEECMKK